MAVGLSKQRSPWPDLPLTLGRVMRLPPWIGWPVFVGAVIVIFVLMVRAMDWLV